MSGTVLIVDDVATNRIALKARLSEAAYEVLQAGDGQTALELARGRRPDLMVLDLVMSGMDGVAVCRALRAERATADIPVIMVTAEGRFEEKMRALEAGADDFLSKPVDEVILRARMRSLLRGREAARELAMREDTRAALGLDEAPAPWTAPGRIGLIAPDRSEAVRWQHALAGRLGDSEAKVMDTETALRPPEGGRPAPDLYLIAARPGGPRDGLALLPELRARSFARHAAIVMAVPEGAAETGAMALDLGANDLVALPVDPRELALRLKTQLSRKRTADRLRAGREDGLRMAVRDGLTGLFNRRYALPHLARTLARADPAGGETALMMIDVDGFKAINDRHGHGAGDALLAGLAGRLNEELRPVDLLARVGGEEFLAMLPNIGATPARRVADRLCRRVRARPLVTPGGREVAVTVSIGLAMCRGAGESGEAALARADRALLDAKISGRDRVTEAALAH